MLVLSRHAKEKIILAVDGEVIATILPIDIRGDKVRIGIEAGPAVAVHREEVWDAIQRNGNQQRSLGERLKERAGKLREQADRLEAKAGGGD